MDVGNLFETPQSGVKETGNLGNACHDMIQDGSPITCLDDKSILALLTNQFDGGFGLWVDPDISNEARKRDGVHQRLKVRWGFK